jgi:CubicO group peptidase (beta-lactamase class C family)
MHAFAAFSFVCSLLALAGRPAQSPPETEQTAGAELTWETLTARFEREQAAGFSGAVIVVHDEKTVLDQGYGLANREKEIAVTPDTMFASGSTPIACPPAALRSRNRAIATNSALPAGSSIRMAQRMYS